MVMAPSPESSHYQSNDTLMITYSIRSGDTLSRVARQHSVMVRDILKHNPQIVNANKLHIGQVIQIPVRKPAQHPVQAPWFPQEGPPWFRLAERERLSLVGCRNFLEPLTTHGSWSIIVQHRSIVTWRRKTRHRGVLRL